LFTDIIPIFVPRPSPQPPLSPYLNYCLYSLYMYMPCKFAAKPRQPSYSSSHHNRAVFKSLHTGLVKPIQAPPECQNTTKNQHIFPLPHLPTHPPTITKPGNPAPQYGTGKMRSRKDRPHSSPIPQAPAPAPTQIRTTRTTVL
jgi:hypothetical protein